MKRLFLLLVLAAAFLLPACAKGVQEPQNGYYTAEAAEFDSHGWKEYVTIYVRDSKIVTVEYNAKNLSGFIKSWDMAYMSTMNALEGTYPNQYTRFFAGELLKGQGNGAIDSITGATHSHSAFELLSKAVVEQAKTGDTTVVLVTIPEPEED